MDALLRAILDDNRATVEGLLTADSSLVAGRISEARYSKAFFKKLRERVLQEVRGVLVHSAAGEREPTRAGYTACSARRHFGTRAAQPGWYVYSRPVRLPWGSAPNAPTIRSSNPSPFTSPAAETERPA